MELFVSYARPDRRRVDTLVERLPQAGIGVWLDSDLIDGQPWWDKSPGQFRSCDAILTVVSRAAVNSQAWRSEREYAARRGKPILPITLEPMPAGLFPPYIARIRVKIEASQAQTGGRTTSWHRTPPLPSPEPHSASAVKIHHGMAVTSAIPTILAIILASIGIAAMTYSQQAAISPALRDNGTALKASSRVMIAFWITIARWIIFIIAAEAASHSGSTTSSVSMLSNAVL